MDTGAQPLTVALLVAVAAHPGGTARYPYLVGVSSILRRYLPLSGSAIAPWAWRNRDDVIDWAAFGVRSAQGLVSGNTDDVATRGAAANGPPR